MDFKTSVICLALTCVALGWLLCLVTGWFRDMFMDEDDEIEENF